MTEPLFPRRKILSAGCLAAASMALPAALAQQAKWPAKPIRIVVAFPPGGLTDAYARLYAEQLTAKFGMQVIVDNKPGAGAIIAIDAVAKSPPDGYTLLMTTSGKTACSTASCRTTWTKTSCPLLPFRPGR